MNQMRLRYKLSLFLRRLVEKAPVVLAKNPEFSKSHNKCPDLSGDAIFAIFPLFASHYVIV